MHRAENFTKSKRFYVKILKAKTFNSLRIFSSKIHNFKKISNSRRLIKCLILWKKEISKNAIMIKGKYTNLLLRKIFTGFSFNYKSKNPHFRIKTKIFNSLKRLALLNRNILILIFKEIKQKVNFKLKLKALKAILKFILVINRMFKNMKLLNAKFFFRNSKLCKNFKNKRNGFNFF